MAYWNEIFLELCTQQIISFDHPGTTPSFSRHYILNLPLSALVSDLAHLLHLQQVVMPTIFRPRFTPIAHLRSSYLSYVFEAHTSANLDELVQAARSEQASPAVLLLLEDRKRLIAPP